jgi:hypothetical protein
MRRTAFTIVAMVVALMGANPGMKFTLTTEKKEYRSGEGIPFTWKLFNGTDRTWLVYRELIGAGYEQVSLHVEGPAGKTTFSPSSPEVAASSISSCWLPPGKTLEGKFELSTWAEVYQYKMPPGPYRISGTFDHSRADRQILKAFAAPICGETALQKLASDQDILDATLLAPQIAFTIR